MKDSKPFYPQAATCGLSTASCAPDSSLYINALRNECACDAQQLSAVLGSHRSDRRGSLTSKKGNS